jgi:hypothetical protein
MLHTSTGVALRCEVLTLPEPPATATGYSPLKLLLCMAVSKHAVQLSSVCGMSLVYIHMVRTVTLHTDCSCSAV